MEKLIYLKSGWPKAWVFLQGRHHPSLRTKKTKSEKDVYELGITKNYRLTFDIEGDTYVLRKVGTHTDILGR